MPVRRMSRNVATGLTVGVLAFSSGWTLHDLVPAPEPAPKVIRVQAPRVIRVDSSQVLELPSEYSPRLVLSGSRNLTAGQFVTAAPGSNASGGFLLKVLHSRVSDGETTVDVRPASLYEAVPNGDITATPSDFSSTPQYENSNAVTAAFSSSVNANSPEVGIPFTEPITCEHAGAIVLSGNIETSLAPYFDLRWNRHRSLRRWRTWIRSARAGVNARFLATAGARAEAEANCELPKTTLVEPRWHAVLQVGPVPVPVTFGIPIKFFGSANAKGRARAIAKAGIKGALGVKYGGGDDAKLIDRPEPFGEVRYAAGASTEAKAMAGPGISVKAGWHVKALGGLAAEASIQITSGLRISYVVGKQPPWEACVPLALTGMIQFHLPLGQKQFANEKDLAEKDVKCFPP